MEKKEKVVRQDQVLDGNQSPTEAGCGNNRLQENDSDRYAEGQESYFADSKREKKSPKVRDRNR